MRRGSDISTYPLDTHLLAPRITSQWNRPSPRGVMTSRPWRKGASVFAWQSRHRAISRSRSKPEPPLDSFDDVVDVEAGVGRLLRLQ